MKIKVVCIGTDFVSLFTEHEEFIGYIGPNMYYFYTEVLKWYDLYENDFIDELRPNVRNSEIKLNKIFYIKSK
jgi:hypothetical protein